MIGDIQTEYAAKRERWIERMRSVSTLDAAFLLHYYNHWERTWGPPPRPAAIAVSEVFSDHEAGYRREAEALAKKMFDAAFDMIEGWHEANARGIPYADTYEPSRQRLIEANPGFNESLYESAMHAANVALR